ncbi:choice-of-anchor D domain-containing protein [Pendulispora brunnea]|uniref:Choice-of-anchor D domain-containing protein n=1 Tax=Pendulispora brunnea TaxID=2905690 RepID=A0ABZ2KLI6_9BACT
MKANSIPPSRATRIAGVVACSLALFPFASFASFGCGAKSNGQGTAGTETSFLKPTGAFLVLAEAFNQVSFDAQPVGTRSAAQSVALQNDGTAPLTIGTLAIAGGQASEFVLGAGTCSGATLAPGGRCTIDVAFAPAGDGPRAATLEVPNDAAGNTHEIPLLGRGRATAGFTPMAGPVDPRHGFPAWYQDGAGVRLEPCLESASLCPSALPDLLEPPAVTRAFTNFPNEMAYWTAEAEIRPTNRIRARLILALEGGFAGVGNVAIGEQIVFGRVRLRLEGVSPSVPYTFTHPFGTTTVSADASGKIDWTEDVGCGGSPCDFRQAVKSQVLQRFLKWDPAFAPQAPPGHLGDPSVAHRIVGSPTGHDFFRVEGSGVGGSGIFTIETNLFELAGKLLP